MRVVRLSENKGRIGAAKSCVVVACYSSESDSTHTTAAVATFEAITDETWRHQEERTLLANFRALFRAF